MSSIFMKLEGKDKSKCDWFLTTFRFNSMGLIYISDVYNFKNDQSFIIILLKHSCISLSYLMHRDWLYFVIVWIICEFEN